MAIGAFAFKGEVANVRHCDGAAFERKAANARRSECDGARPPWPARSPTGNRRAAWRSSPGHLRDERAGLRNGAGDLHEPGAAEAAGGGRPAALGDPFGAVRAEVL